MGGGCKGMWFLVLVLVGCFAITVLYREVSGPRGAAARDVMLGEMWAWGRSVGLAGVEASDLSVCMKSDFEGVVKILAQGFADTMTVGATPLQTIKAPHESQMILAHEHCRVGLRGYARFAGLSRQS